MATHPALLEALAPPSTPALRKISSTLLASLRTHLQTPNGPTMLPSFTHTLPTGAEPGGTAVAIDLGGSTLRVAVVSIDDAGGHKFLVCGKWGIDDEVKKLPGERFFDYIAERVAGVLEKAGAPHVRDVGITWSFPIIQTGPASGRIQKMGKGYHTHEGIMNADFKTLFEAALARRGLHHLRLIALINDTTATLLSHPGSLISLICGTGVNAAMLLPTAALHVSKLTFPSETIVVNTECSMLGEGLFPLTPADRALNAASDNPGFQPFEQLISGRYLGEIARLTLEAAGEKVGGRFSLESEETGEAGTFKSRVVAAVGTRAAAFLAAMVAALWELGGGGDEVVVACAGAVVEGRVLGECQGFLDGLVGEGRVRLVVVRDAGLVGAAVAAVEAQREGRASKSRLEGEGEQ